MMPTNRIRAALMVAAALGVAEPDDAGYLEPAGRGRWILRDRPPRRSQSQHGKGKRRAKNKAARKAASSRGAAGER